MSNERELIDTGTDKRYVRRDEEGRFKESVDVSRSLSQDVAASCRDEEAEEPGGQGGLRILGLSFRPRAAERFDNLRAHRPLEMRVVLAPLHCAVQGRGVEVVAQMAGGVG